MVHDHWPASPNRIAIGGGDLSARERLRQMQPLVTRVLAQTRSRLLGGDTHVRDKVLSVFEPHTEAIRKGKVAKPTEFGKLVTIRKAASNHHDVCGPCDATRRYDAVDAALIDASRSLAVHRIWPPPIAASPGQERRRGARARGPTRSHPAATRTENAGTTPPRTGSADLPCADSAGVWVRRTEWCIKRRHGLRRCRYHGADGIARWVGLGVIADNLVNTATFLNARVAA